MAGKKQLRSKKCPNCKEQFDYIRKRKYCSKKCLNAAYYKRTKHLNKGVVPKTSEFASKTQGDSGLQNRGEVAYSWPADQEDECLAGCVCPICTQKYVDQYGYIHRTKTTHRETLLETD